jgi:small GTP-binding protein
LGKPKIFKIITAGDGGVGKTTLLHRYIEGKFLADTRMTIGVEFFIKELEIENDTIIIQIWDFGGQEQFRFLHKKYIMGAKGALLLFDLTRLSTLRHLDEWVEISREEDPNLPILFIGTKLDLSNLIVVKDSDAIEYKEKYDLFQYLKISSKTGENVKLAFELLAKEIIKNILLSNNRKKV